jgi:hypothetical protein
MEEGFTIKFSSALGISVKKFFQSGFPVYSDEGIKCA